MLFYLPGQASIVGPPPTYHESGEGRDQVYFMSATLEKHIFPDNSSNPLHSLMCVLE